MYDFLLHFYSWHYILMLPYEERSTMTKKHIIEVYPFAYHKISAGQRKIDIRPYVERLHSVCVGDTIEYVNAENQARLQRQVVGVALFGDFDTLIDMLPPNFIGYENREEIRVRVERMYPKQAQKENGVCAFFLGEPDVRQSMKMNNFER